MTSTSLIGRDADIAEVARLLEGSDVRLVTLTGPGGIGKTRLAIALGERLDGRFTRGTVFVPLASVAQVELVASRIADAVGAILEGARSPLDVLVEHLADTSMLLVLDNLEQVVGVAPELDHLLAHCPGLKILATSRTALRLRAEREYEVAALASPVASDLPPLDELASMSAVRLFVDRATAVRYDFALTEENAADVVAICRRLDGLPLAIELAAARTRLLEPHALLLRLQNSLDALGAGPVDLPERQRTLRATVEWSFGLLDESERQMLEVLSIFVDGWTVDAAVHVSGVGEDQVLDLLDALAGHSLVHVEAADAGPRFRMLTSVRELAAERLSSGTRLADVERKHADFFGGLVANDDWPMERQAAWAEQLRVEEENLRVAIRWFLAHDIAPLPHLFRILWLFWQMRGRMPEGRAWIAEVQRRAAALDGRARAELEFTAAITAVEVGDDAAALAALDELRRPDGRADDPYLDSAAQLAISWILPLVDDFEGALGAASAALEGFRKLDDPFVAFAALTVGMVDLALGRDEQAWSHLAEVVDLGARFDNRWLESSARSQLASLAVRAGRMDDARAFVAASVDAGEDTEVSTLTMCFSLVAAARLALADGDAGRAAMALGAADGLRRRAGLRAWPSTRRGEAEIAAGVAQHIAPGEYEAAWTTGAALTHREAAALVHDAARPIGSRRGDSSGQMPT